MLRIPENQPTQTDPQRDVTCPTTRGQAYIVDYQSTHLSGETIVWWRCSLCRGWHILVDHTKKRCPQE